MRVICHPAGNIWYAFNDKLEVLTVGAEGKSLRITQKNGIIVEINILENSIFDVQVELTRD